MATPLVNTKRPKRTQRRSHTWSAGCVYNVRQSADMALPSWRIEWSSGYLRKPDGRVRSIGLSVRGSYEDARTLLDWIVEVPYRSREQAMMVIEPYIERIPTSGGMVCVIKSPLPATSYSRQQKNRERIELEYWRMRLLDTVEAYRRYDD